MSDTPETDAAELIYDGIVASGYADADVCRKLERERDQARRELDIQLESIKFHMERVPVMQLSLEAQRDFCMGEIERLRKERNEAREVAENLVEYAHECLVRLESWGKGYDRYEREMETIREAIAGCQKWKEAAK